MNQTEKIIPILEEIITMLEKAEKSGLTIKDVIEELKRTQGMINIFNKHNAINNNTHSV